MKIKNDLCMTCYGTGKWHGNHCPDCNGTGIAATMQRWGCVLVVLSVVAFVGLIAYFVT